MDSEMNEQTLECRVFWNEIMHFYTQEKFVFGLAEGMQNKLFCRSFWLIIFVSAPPDIYSDTLRCARAGAGLWVCHMYHGSWSVTAASVDTNVSAPRSWEKDMQSTHLPKPQSVIKMKNGQRRHLKYITEHLEIFVIILKQQESIYLDWS